MSLLTICRQAIGEIGSVETPDTIVGNSNETAKQILALAQREGQELARRHTWSALQREHVFATTSGVESYALPSDWRQAIDETAWDRTNNRPMPGSVGPRAWQVWKSGLIATADVWTQFRVKWDSSAGARRIFVDPVPSSAKTLVVEYLSQSWCQSSSGTLQAGWIADSDTALLDEDLIQMGLIWRFLKAKGLPYQEEFNSYERSVDRAIEADVPSRRIRLGGPRRGELRNPNLPDTGYG